MPTADVGCGEVSVPWGAWRQDSARTFVVPRDWQVSYLGMENAPAASAVDLAAALDRPINASRLEELVTSASRVAIAIDDMTRPTPAEKVVGALIERLAAAGVPDHSITLVVASGAHRPATQGDLEQKIGEPLARRFRVVAHDPMGSLVDTGVKLAGVPVRVNRIFYEADVRIGIGAVMPHPFAAFSGGGKIVIPGLADLDVLVRTHKYALMGLAGGRQLANNRFRADMEAAVRAIGLQWTVNVVVNAERQVAFVAAGDFVAAHRAAANVAARCGHTEPPPEPLHALLLNAYPKDGELLQIEAAFVALRSGMLDWLTTDAPVVLMAACSEGLGTHGLFGPGGRLFRVPSARSFFGGRQLIAFSPGVEEAEVRQVFWGGYPFYREWAALIEALGTLLPPSPKVGVVPCGPLQLAGTACGRT